MTKLTQAEATAIMSRTFRSSEIQDLARVQKVSFNNWINQGAIIPLEDIRGRGKVRVFSWQNLVEAIICRELNRYRLETSVMVMVLSRLRRGDPPATPSLWQALKDNIENKGNYHIVISEWRLGELIDSQTGEPVHDISKSISVFYGTLKQARDHLLEQRSALFLNTPVLVEEALTQ